MTPRKPKATAARRSKRESGGTDAFVEAVRGFGVTLEDVRSQMKVVIEALQECATKREVEELRDQHTDLRGQMKVVIEVLQECATKREVAELRGQYEELRGQMTMVIEALHDRPTRRELEGRFDRIDGEIRDLRQEVASQKQGAEIRALEHRVTVLEQSG